MKEIHRVRVWNKKGVERSIEKLPGDLRAARGHSPPFSKEAPNPGPNPRGGPGFHRTLPGGMDLFGAHERSPDPANPKYRLVTRMRESRCTFHWLFPVLSRSSESTPPVPTRPKGTSATNNEDERQNAIQQHTTQQSARDYQFHPG